MMDYFLVKYIHILSATILFGTGLGSVFYKWSADRSGDVAAQYVTNKNVVLADWYFTTPAIIIQPVSGLYLLHLQNFQTSQTWFFLTLALFLVAGICWLPVVYLQIRMRDLAKFALEMKRPLTAQYYRYAKRWLWLGIPAFTAIVLLYGLMVVKRIG